MEREKDANTIGTSHEDGQRQLWEKLWSKEVSYRWDSLSELVLHALCETAGPLQGTRILEAGSGTGKISLRLAMEGADVTLVDYAQQALDQSQIAFRLKNRRAVFVRSDIRSMPFEENRYDICWNAGVLEHFSNAEKVNILQEMARVTKPGGRIIVFVPYSGCLPYRMGKAYAEQAGTWPYGVEMPVATLEETFQLAGIRLIGEYGIGFEESLEFLDFIPEMRPFKDWLRLWHSRLGQEEQKLFPGYLLLAHGLK